MRNGLHVCRCGKPEAEHLKERDCPKSLHIECCHKYKLHSILLTVIDHRTGVVTSYTDFTPPGIIAAGPYRIENV